MGTLYIFLDEGGNFDFSPSGSSYFTLTSVSFIRPFTLHTTLDTYKYDLLEFRGDARLNIDHFHCADDNSHVRQRVFSILAEHLRPRSVDAVVVEKQKTNVSLQAPEKFYPKMLGYLLRYAIGAVPDSVEEVLIITDRIPLNRKRNAVEKGIRGTLASMMPSRIPYRIMHHESRAHYGLQIADYMNWAILRKWERGDRQYYDIVEHLVRSEFDIFEFGTTHYY